MSRYELWRHRLADGEETTIYAVRSSAPADGACLHFPRPQRLDVWCAAHGVGEAIVGGFFLRDPYRAARRGLDRRRRRARMSRSRRRTAAARVRGHRRRRRAVRPRAATRPPRRRGDLVQAGPLLVAGGALAFDAANDREGFSAGSGQFDSDITDGRHPRAALGSPAGDVIAVACDGRRSGVDAGLSMLELAAVMLELGAESAINLDGGGSTTLVHRGHLLNRPYSTRTSPRPQSRADGHRAGVRASA